MAIALARNSRSYKTGFGNWLKSLGEEEGSFKDDPEDMKTLSGSQQALNRSFSGIQSRLTLCSPMDSSLPGSSIHGIFQARILDGVPFPTPGDLPNSGIKPVSLLLLHWQMDSLSLVPSGKPIYLHLHIFHFRLRHFSKLLGTFICT